MMAGYEIPGSSGRVWRIDGEGRQSLIAAPSLEEYAAEMADMREFARKRREAAAQIDALFGQEG